MRISARLLALLASVVLAFGAVIGSFAEEGALPEATLTSATAAAEPTATPEPTVKPTPTPEPTATPATAEPPGTDAPTATPATPATAEPPATDAPTATPATVEPPATDTPSLTPDVPTPEPTEPSASPAGEPTPSPFAGGLVKLSAGTILFADQALAVPAGTLLAEGVAYASVDLENRWTLITHTVDNLTLAEAYVDAAALQPLSEVEIAAYAAQPGELLFQGYPLFALSLEPVGEEPAVEAFSETDLSYEMLTYGFPGMPGDYVFSAEELAAKAALTENGTLEQTRAGIPGQDYVTDEVLLLAETEAFAQRVAESYAAVLASYGNGLAVIKLEGFTVLEAIAAAADPLTRLVAVEPNHLTYLEPDQASGGKKADALPRITLAAAPTLKTWADFKDMDPFLQNPGSASHYTTRVLLSSGYQYMHDMVDTYAAWGLTTGDPDVKVGILDSGFSASHPELSGKITDIPNRDEASALSDAFGHGTHVAGIIAARQNNHEGGCGIAPDVKLLGYKVVDDGGRISTAAIYNGLYKMRTSGAWVINMSLGGPAHNSVEESAVEDCLREGIPIIAAVGNDGGGTHIYPASYPSVIAVGAVDPMRQRAPYSNHGGSVTLSAPGSYILSTYRGSSTAYMSLSGTSMSTPVVTGVAALYYSARGTRDLNGDGQTNEADVTFLRNVLTESCTRISGGMGAGIVNAGALFKKIITKPAFSLTLGETPYTDLSQVPNAAVVHLTPGFNGSYMVYTTDGTTPSVKNGAVLSGTEALADPALPLTKYPSGQHTLKAISVNAQGVSSRVATFTFTIDSKMVKPAGLLITGPAYLYPARSAAYKATLTPASSLKVNWSVVSGAATIGATNGKLALKRTAAGDVVIRAAVRAYPDVFAEYTVHVTSSLVRKLIPSQSSLVLNVGDPATEITVAAKLKNGETVDLRTAESYSFRSSTRRRATIVESESGWLVTPVSKGRATLYFTALDGSGVTLSVPVYVKQPATGLSIEDGAESSIVLGMKRSLKAVLTPVDVSSRAVAWTLVSAPAGVTLSKSGTLKVPSSVSLEESNKVEVRCDTRDGSGLSFTQTLTVFPSPVKSITLTSTDPKVAKDGSRLLSGTLFTLDLENSPFGASHDETRLQLSYTATGPAVDTPVQWTSSNPKVATVDGTGLVTAVKAGSATITCTAKDGSSRRAKIPLRVVVPNSSIRIFPSTASVTRDTPLIGYGTSSRIKVTYGNTYGTPTVKAVKWSFSVTSEDGDITAYCKAHSLVKLSGAGLLSVKKHPHYDVYSVTVTAATTDGTNLQSSVTYIAQPAITKLAIWGARSAALSAYKNNYCEFFFYTDNAHSDDFTITSSNPSVAAPFDYTGRQVLYSYVGSLEIRGKTYYKMKITVMGYGPGTARITVKTNDGSKKSIAYTAVVK